MFIPAVKNLFPASQIAEPDKPKVAGDVYARIYSSLSPYVGLDRDRGEADSQQKGYARELANAMVRGDEDNSVEAYFPRGMATRFINALAASGYVPGPNDKDTIDVVSKIIDLKVTDNLNGRYGFYGDFNLQAIAKEDGYHLEVNTTAYMGRGADGEKQYKSSKSIEVGFIPHDEISSRIYQQTKNTGINGPSINGLLDSKSFLKAKGLEGYLDALLMTSGF